MSKHQKHVRRERKKTEVTRRTRAFRHPTSHIKHGAAALAAAAAIAAGTSAYASPVRFDNPAHAAPGHFEWAGGLPGTPIGLDITLDASSQTGGEWSQLPTEFGQHGEAAFGQVDAGVGAALQVGGYGNYFLVGVNSGETIPSGFPWDLASLIYYQGYGSGIPAGQPTYLGVRFHPGDGLHYGWIGVVRQNTTELEAFAWGYETEPGVSIPAGAPEPGSLALLAFGGAAALRRRLRP